MTAVDVEVESIEHLDFEHETPCDAPDCGQTAEYSITCRSPGCDSTTLACAACTRAAVEWANAQPAIFCRRCLRYGEHIHDVFHIHPLH